MATYEFSLKSISRTDGKSAVASAAYRSGEKLQCEVKNREFDYTKKQGIDNKVILLPDGADSKFLDRKTLWSEVEKSRVYKSTRRGASGHQAGDYIPNAELAKELQLSLPIELNKEDSYKLVEDFCKKHFVSKGLACDVCFHHMDGHNPHCHIMITTRSIEESNLTKKARWLKEKSCLQNLRNEFEIVLNKEFVLKGIDERVTAKSYRDRGIDIVGVSTKFNDFDREYVNRIKSENTKVILNDINSLACALTDKKALITMSEVYSFLKRNVLESEIDNVKEQLLNCNNFLEIKSGKFTSYSYLQKELELRKNIEKLNMTNSNSREVSWDYAAGVSKDKGLTPEQEKALVYALTNDSNLKNIRGFAGAGKSYTVGAIVDVFKQAGFDVKGAALSGVVAEALGNDCKIDDSSTIASFLYRYEKGTLDISEDTVLIIDEASMVGTSDYEKITAIMSKHNAKLINVGDEEQLKAISAGGANRLILQNSTVCELSEVRRQEKGDRRATINLSRGEQKLALDYYRQQKSIHKHIDEQDMLKEVVATYFEDTTNINLKTGKKETSIIMAYQNNTVGKINDTIQKTLLKTDRLNSDRFIQNGEKKLYEGDRFIFLENSRDIGVMNGTVGTIHHIEGSNITVMLDSDSDKLISFDANKYKSFDLAYASTIHKMQGATLDNTQFIMDRASTSDLTLVGCSRHRKNFKLHYQIQSDTNPNGIKDYEDLVKTAENKSKKELIADYDRLLIDSFKSNNPDIMAQIEREYDTPKALQVGVTKSVADKPVDKVKQILDRDTKVSKENKKLKDNSLLLNKLIELDRDANKYLAMHHDYNKNKDKYKDLPSKERIKYVQGKAIADEKFRQRNELLESFDRAKLSFSDNVKNSKRYEQVKKMHDKQKAYKEKIQSRSRSMEYDF